MASGSSAWVPSARAAPLRWAAPCAQTRWVSLSAAVAALAARARVPAAAAAAPAVVARAARRRASAWPRLALLCRRLFRRRFGDVTAAYLLPRRRRLRRQLHDHRVGPQLRGAVAHRLHLHLLGIGQIAAEREGSGVAAGLRMRDGERAGRAAGLAVRQLDLGARRLGFEPDGFHRRPRFERLEPLRIGRARRESESLRPRSR